VQITCSVGEQLGTSGFVFVERAVAEPVLPVRVGLDADRAEHGSGDHGLLVVTARAAVTTKRLQYALIGLHTGPRTRAMDPAAALN
jgi:hypothetical protein